VGTHSHAGGESERAALLVGDVIADIEAPAKQLARAGELVRVDRLEEGSDDRARLGFARASSGIVAVGRARGPDAKTREHDGGKESRRSPSPRRPGSSRGDNQIQYHFAYRTHRRLLSVIGAAIQAAPRTWRPAPVDRGWTVAAPKTFAVIGGAPPAVSPVPAIATVATAAETNSFIGYLLVGISVEPSLSLRSEGSLSRG
jgi:hypothetical protein